MRLNGAFVSEATSEVLIPYSRASSSSAITKHLLATLSDEANPITHSKAGTKPVGTREVVFFSPL